MMQFAEQFSDIENVVTLSRQLNAVELSMSG